MLFAHDGLWSIICDAGTRTKVCLGHDVLVTQITFKGTPSGSRSTVELEYQAFDGEAKSCQIASLIPGQVENVSLQLPLKSQAEHCIVNSGTSNISLVGFYMSSGEPTLPMPHPPYWPWAAMHSPAINPPHVPAAISVTPLAVPALGTGPASRTRRSVARTSSELTIPDEEVKPAARKRKSSLADVKPPLKPAVKRPRAIRKGLAADDTVSIDPSIADPDTPASGKAVVPTTVPVPTVEVAHSDSDMARAIGEPLLQGAQIAVMHMIYKLDNDGKWQDYKRFTAKEGKSPLKFAIGDKEALYGLSNALVGVKFGSIREITLTTSDKHVIHDIPQGQSVLIKVRVLDPKTA